MTKEELAMERNEVREILEGFSEELSQSNLDKLSRVFCLINGDEKCFAELEKENAELRKVAEFQQSSNMNRHFENKKLKEGLAVGSTFNKALNSMNKTLEEERDKYRNMVFDKDGQLTKAKEIIKNLMVFAEIDCREYEEAYKEAEQFVKE